VIGEFLDAATKLAFTVVGNYVMASRLTVALMRTALGSSLKVRDARTLYDRTVNRNAVDILKEALALPSKERAALAASLLDSLDSDVDEDAEAAWAIEMDRRVTELDAGAVKTIAWAEVRRRLAAH